MPPPRPTSPSLTPPQPPPPQTTTTTTPPPPSSHNENSHTVNMIAQWSQTFSLVFRLFKLRIGSTTYKCSITEQEVAYCYLCLTFQAEEGKACPVVVRPGPVPPTFKGILFKFSLFYKCRVHTFFKLPIANSINRDSLQGQYSYYYCNNFMELTATTH